MPLAHLTLLPDSQGYQVQDGTTAIANTLDGGGPRVRADILGAVKTVNCQWTVGPQNFDFMIAFHRTTLNYGANPFNIDLLGIDKSGQGTYQAWIVPGSWLPTSSQSGLTYVIKTQLWVVPINDTTNDAAIIAAGPIA